MSFTKLDIKELQNRLDAISEAQVNEYYVKSAKDVLTTLPAFAYRASDPVDAQPEDKMYTAAVGDRAEMLYNKLRKWLAAGNDFSSEEIEALDQAASAPEFMGPTSETDDQDVIDMLNSGLDTLEDIIGNKTESFEKGINKMNKLDIKEIQSRLDAINEEHSIMVPSPGRIGGEIFNQEMFNITHAISQVAKTLLPKMQAMDLQRPEYAADEDAAKYYGLELDDEPENINFGAYRNLDDSDKEKFMANYKEPPVVNPDVLQSVQEGEAELAELKDMLGRSGVMGFTQ
tara:strand:+ start:182 stop:1042 length:861 start_codon:yes stop_codon:yes gene_type:complete